MEPWLPRRENVGVPPDIEIEQTPAEVIAGRDPQLEKAIEIVMDELKKNPSPQHKRPPYPVRVTPVKQVPTAGRN
jgi:tricorn protease